MVRKKTVIAFVISLLLLFSNLLSCTQIESSTNLTPQEIMLPLVFNDMDQLRSRYDDFSAFSDYGYSYGSSLFRSPYFDSDFKFSGLTETSNLPSVPDRLTAYSIVRPKVNYGYAQNLAKKLGFTGAIVFNETYQTYSTHEADPNGPPSLLIFEDGLIHYEYYKVPMQGTNLPSDEKCIDIARNWLESCGLFPDNVINCTAAQVITHVMQGYYESEYVSATKITFQIGFDGYPILGLGACVIIGDDGKVLQANINAPQFKACGYVRLQQPEAGISIFQDYLKNPNLFKQGTPLCLISSINPIVKIESVSLQYFAMLNVDDTQPAYVQPVYIIKGEGRSTEGANWVTFIGAAIAVAQ